MVVEETSEETIMENLVEVIEEIEKEGVDMEEDPIEKKAILTILTEDLLEEIILKQKEKIEDLKEDLTKIMIKIRNNKEIIDHTRVKEEKLIKITIIEMEEREDLTEEIEEEEATEEDIVEEAMVNIEEEEMANIEEDTEAEVMVNTKEE